MRFDFSQSTRNVIQSPEDKILRQNISGMTHLPRLMNLKCFDNVSFIFSSGQTLSANSAILQARSDYFRSMLSKQNCFRESQTNIVIKGI